MKTNHIKVDLPKEKIADFCRRHHIRKLAVFGSALREDFRPDSDLDVLVEFDPDHTPGLAFFGMEQELSELLGRNVDFEHTAVSKSLLPRQGACRGGGAVCRATTLTYG